MYATVTGEGKYRVIQFKEETRIPGTKKKKSRVIKTIGNYEKMISENPNIMEELRAEAKRITLEQKASKAPIRLEVSSEDIEYENDVTKSYYFGHGLVLQLWKKLKLDAFFLTQTGKREPQQMIEAILYLLIHRCGDPSSILACANDQGLYAGINEIDLNKLYDVLDVLDQSKDALIKHLAKFFSKNTNRDNAKAYYDVTTYSFESTRWGELRMFGFSKNGKNNEVQVVMGLLIDNNGIPVTYELFPGNTMDQKTLTQSVSRLKELYHLDKITVVADRGLNSGDNLGYLCDQGHDFVISYTLKRSTDKFKAMVWNEDGWSSTINTETGEIIAREKILEEELNYKVPLEVKEEDPNNVKKKGRPRKYETKTVPVNIHLTWSAARAAKDRGDRERMLERLRKKLDKPYQLKASVKRGVNQFLQMELDTSNWTLSEDKILEAERYDGYYAVITNNKELSTKQVIEIYRGLWKIEESFRILKTDLRASPVYVWNDGHVRGHFALCFLALSMMRFAQHLLLENEGMTVSAAKLMEAIHDPKVVVQGSFPKVVVTPIQVSDTYLALSKTLGMKPLKKNMTLTQFRASTKLDLVINLK